MARDHISKAVKGRYFPLTAAELGIQVRPFATWSPVYCKRISLLMENCTVETPLGHQLCSFLPKNYVAVFSLPEAVPLAVSKQGVAVALERFLEIERGPAPSTREQQFVMYRAYLGPMGALTVAQHVINGGPRPHWYYREVSQLSKAWTYPVGQRELCKVQIASPLFG